MITSIPSERHVEPIGYPVAVGAIGGSGTRLLASLLQRLDYHIGTDLNRALDNLWFTLLFKRRSVLVEPTKDLHFLFDAFKARLAGRLEISNDLKMKVEALAAVPRTKHDLAWLEKRSEAFLDANPEVPRGTLLGFKEPNTHVVIERLLGLDPQLRYIHVVRDGLEMATSTNLTQLMMWGDLYLDRPVSPCPADALAYWCAVHRRIDVIAEQHAPRVLVIDYRNMCNGPGSMAREIADFLNRPIDDIVVEEFRNSVRPSRRLASESLVKDHSFAADDLEYARNYRSERPRLFPEE